MSQHSGRFCRYLSKISEKSSSGEDSRSDEDEQEQEEDEEEDDTEDGYGWAVVFASFLCIAVIDGVGYTTGKWFVAKLTHLGP